MSKRREREAFLRRFFEALHDAGYPKEFEFEGLTYIVRLGAAVKLKKPDFEERWYSAWVKAGMPETFTFEGRTRRPLPGFAEAMQTWLIK